MNKFVGLAVFVTGAAIGSIATWTFLKKKYEAIAQEEIESVKTAFSSKEYKNDCEEISNKENKEDPREIANRAKEKMSVSEYAKVLNKSGYTNYSNSESSKKEETDLEEAKKKFKPPYVISPDEFGEYEDYAQISLTYYADHILTDDNDEILEDVEGAVGFESLNHFGEYEDDSVFVRNERLKVDYEILLDQRDYSDVIKSKPYLMEDYDTD